MKSDAVAVVTVRYGANLARIAGTRAVDVTLDPQECTVGGLLRKLAGSNSRELARELIGGQEERPICLVTINDRLVPPTTAAEAALKDGDRVKLIPPLSGGSGWQEGMVPASQHRETLHGGS